MLLLILQYITDVLGGERSTVRALRVAYGVVFEPNSSFLVPFCDHVSEGGVFVAAMILPNVFCMF